MAEAKAEPASSPPCTALSLVEPMARAGERFESTPDDDAARRHRID